MVELRVLLLYRARQALHDLRVLDDHRRIGGQDPQLAGELSELVRIDRDEGDGVRPAVAVHHDLAHERIGLEGFSMF